MFTSAISGFIVQSDALFFKRELIAVCSRKFYLRSFFDTFIKLCLVATVRIGLNMAHKDIYYSDKYTDDKYEYRYICGAHVRVTFVSIFVNERVLLYILRISYVNNIRLSVTAAFACVYVNLAT